MTVHVERRGVKQPRYRLVETETGKIARRESGAAVDGGGHSAGGSGLAKARR